MKKPINLWEALVLLGSVHYKSFLAIFSSSTNHEEGGFWCIFTWACVINGTPLCLEPPETWQTVVPRRFVSQATWIALNITPNLEGVSCTKKNCNKNLKSRMTIPRPFEDVYTYGKLLKYVEVNILHNIFIPHKPISHLKKHVLF